MLCLAVLACACDSGFGESGAGCSFDIRISLPDEVDAENIRDASLSLKNLSNGSVATYGFPLAGDSKVLPGIYDVEFSAKATTADGRDMDVRGVARSVQIMTDNALVSIKTFCSVPTDDLIIVEIFFTGTLQPSGNPYYGDDYVKLYNNTDHVVYADGLTLFESKFLTTQKLAFTPDIMAEAVTVQALYTIPGNGSEHPVYPGEYLLLADVGIDHRQVNPCSFDLSHADWEWYDVSTVPSQLDIDSPAVPNLDKWYCYTQSFWMLHNRGFKAFGIARIPVSRESYLADYRYSYDYELVTAAGSFPMSMSAYMIPNGWVVDVVNCSVESEWQWNVTDPTLDMGWTWCGTIDADKTRYFHSVRRKLLYIETDGRAVFKDTNNSSEDFNPNVTPSEIELQGSPAGIGKGPADKETYDGIEAVENIG